MVPRRPVAGRRDGLLGSSIVAMAGGTALPLSPRPAFQFLDHEPDLCQHLGVADRECVREQPRRLRAKFQSQAAANRRGVSRHADLLLPPSAAI
jgi:hypothetical protein